MHVRTVRTRRPCRAATAVASLIAASGAASAADRDWNGPPNADWNTPGFWSPAALPNAADTAWIGRLTQNSVVRITVPPQIGDLRISNGMIVEGFGGSLDVQDDVFVSGSNMVGDNRFRSQLRVKPAGVSAISVDVGDALSISDGGQIRLLGGVLRVDGLLSTTADSIISGSGTIRLRSNAAVAARFAAPIDPDTAGGIVIEQQGTGLIDLDGLSELGEIRAHGGGPTVGAYDRLTVIGTELQDSYSGTIWLVSGGELAMNLSAGWTADANSVIRVISTEPATQPARFTGGHAELLGELIVTGQGAEARFLSAATTGPTFAAELMPGTRLRFVGDTTVEGGTFHAEPDAAVVFAAPTEWRGAAHLSGLVTQDGDAMVSAPTTIDADVFDMDGGPGITHWEIANALTIDTVYIDRSNGRIFNGSMDIGPSFPARLEIDLPQPTDSWVMSGEMTLAGAPVTYVERLAGSPVQIRGHVEVSERVLVSAAVRFEPASTVLLPAGAFMRLGGPSEIYAGASFAGSGELQNAASGSMHLRHGAALGGARLRNDGELRIGDGPASASANAFVQGAAGVWRVQIGGDAPGSEYDLLSLTGGNASLAGAIEVELLDLGSGTLIPEVGDVYTILSGAAAVNGAFAGNPVTHVGNTTVRWNVGYGTTTVSLQVAAVESCQADFDADGTVDVNDLLGFLGAFRNAAPAADIDASGDVDVNDLLSYLGLFRAGC